MVIVLKNQKKRGEITEDKKTAAPVMRAVIYARYSSGNQREESIEGQLRDCYEFARKNEMNIIGEYVDRALTGRTDKRPDFQRMLRDSERGCFDAVIMWKMDRFARNRYDSAIYKYKLKKNGVRIFYAKEMIPEGPEGIILESVMEGYAEYYSENLSQNVQRGFYDSALELKTLGQRVLGYKTGTDGRFTIDAGNAAVVRRIFEEYAKGERAKDIYTRLNDEGYRTSRDGPFNKNSIRRILQNEKYIGIYEYQDIRVENGIPAIVDKELFEKVQTIIEKNHASPGRKRGLNFLLTTKLFCGHCGSPMTGDSGTSHTGQTYTYYTCNKRKYEHNCKKERVSKDWIERLVVQKLVQLVNSDKFIKEVADKVLAYQQHERDRSALDALEARKKDNEKAISNIVAAIEAGVLTPSTKTRLMELESERENINKGIAQELIENPSFSQEEMVFYLKRFRNGHVKDKAYCVMLIDTFLNSVFLYDDDKFVLCMNYSGENSKITLPIAEKALKSEEYSSRFAPSGAPNGAKIQAFLF